MGNALDTFRNPPEIDLTSVTLPPVGQMPPAALRTAGTNFCANSPDVYGNNAYFNCLDVINLHVWNPPAASPFGVMQNSTPLVTNGSTAVTSSTGWTKPGGTFYINAIPVIAGGMQFQTIFNGMAEIDLQVQINLANVTGMTIGQTLILGASFLNNILGSDFGFPLLVPYVAASGFIVARAQWLQEWSMGGSPPQTWSPPRYFITGPAGANLTMNVQLLKIAFIDTF